MGMGAQNRGAAGVPPRPQMPMSPRPQVPGGQTAPQGLMALMQQRGKGSGMPSGMPVGSMAPGQMPPSPMAAGGPGAMDPRLLAAMQQFQRLNTQPQGGMPMQTPAFDPRMMRMLGGR